MGRLTFHYDCDCFMGLTNPSSNICSLQAHFSDDDVSLTVCTGRTCQPYQRQGLQGMGNPHCRVLEQLWNFTIRLGGFELMSMKGELTMGNSIDLLEVSNPLQERHVVCTDGDEHDDSSIVTLKANTGCR